MAISLRDALKVYKSRNDKHGWFDCCVQIYKEEGKEAYPLVLDFRRSAMAEAVCGTNTEENMGFAKKSYFLSAQDVFEDYLLYIEWERDPQKSFYMPRRKQLKRVADALQRLADDEIDLLTVSMPPGVGKSATAIFYLTWLAGRNPQESILGGSHNTAFLRGVYDECLRIMQPDGEYLWGDVFPGVKIAKTNAQDLMIDLGEAKRFATLEFTSIGAGNAGKVRAMQLLYCDDLCSGIEEAMSRERLDTLWTKYTTDLKQRKMGKCKELHIATRWSTADVIGRLEQENSKNKRAEFITMPALDENDESLFDYGMGIGFNTKFFHDMRDSMDDVSFRALYMNQPIEREGRLYDPQDLRRFYELPEGEPDAVLAVCDTAEGGGDDTVLPVFAVYGNDHYCIDCVCSDALPDVTDGLCAEVLVRNKVKMCQFESNSAGGRTADKVNELVRANGGNTHITKKRTTANKQTKIIVNSPFIKSNCLFLDENKVKKGSSYWKMLDKLCSYTVSVKNKHDDVPDAMAQYALYVQSLTSSTAMVVKRPF